jgi:hypothetical protein
MPPFGSERYGVADGDGRVRRDIRQYVAREVSTKRHPQELYDSERRFSGAPLEVIAHLEEGARAIL